MSKCNPNCTYFPDMTVKPGEWDWDEEIPYIKRRIDKKVFRCGYDGHDIDWNIECPINMEDCK